MPAEQQLAVFDRAAPEIVRSLPAPADSNDPSDLGCSTIEDGQLLFCGHPMWFPVVRYQFDIRNCSACEYFRPTSRSASAALSR